jgi:hypothetical protein
LQRDHLTLREVVVGHAHGLGQIEYRLSRRADDLRQLGVTTSQVTGKGAIDCERQVIVVWSMGMSDALAALHTAPLCPGPKPDTTAAVACARRGVPAVTR